MSKEQDVQLQAQGVFDAFRLLDKDLVDKVLAIARTIKIEEIDGGTATRITLELKNQK